MATTTDVTITNPTTPATKTGWRTSEFALKLLAFVLTYLYASGVVPTTGLVAQAIAMIATMLGAIGYTVARTYAKRAASLTGGSTLLESRTGSTGATSSSVTVVPPSKS